MPRNLNEIVRSWIRLLYVVQGQDTSVRDQGSIDQGRHIARGRIVQRKRQSSLLDSVWRINGTGYKVSNIKVPNYKIPNDKVPNNEIPK